MSRNHPDLESKADFANQVMKNQAKDERHRQYKKVNKHIKRKRDPKPRRKEWLPAQLGNLDDLDELDDLDLVSVERIMPPGEQDRRKILMARAARALEDEPKPPEAPAGRRLSTVLYGIVVEVSSSLCRVSLDGQDRLCMLRGTLTARDSADTNVVAIGDEVIVTDDGLGGGIVEQVMPRRSALIRVDPFHTHQRNIIAANVEQLVIIAAWREPNLWPELIDRYLITAERNYLQPVLCVNKVDLAEDRALCQATLQPYHDLGIPVLFASAFTHEGIEDLSALLNGHTTVLAGLSGVGKSSLISAVQPGLQLRTNQVSEHSGQGQHTTTQATLLPLNGGGFVVDTPGIREFGLNGLNRADLQSFYPDIAPHAEYCRFDNCAHVHETDCAVQKAVEAGTFSALRYDNYCKIYETLAS